MHSYYNSLARTSSYNLPTSRGSASLSVAPIDKDTLERQKESYLKFRNALQIRDHENRIILEFLRTHLYGLSAFCESDFWHLIRHHQPRIRFFQRGLIIRFPVNTWFILLSGSLLIDNQLYLPFSSFGPERRSCGGDWSQMQKNSALLTNGSKSTECLTLESSELLLIDYHCNGLTTATFEHNASLAPSLVGQHLGYHQQHVQQFHLQSHSQQHHMSSPPLMHRPPPPQPPPRQHSSISSGSSSSAHQLHQQHSLMHSHHEYHLGSNGSIGSISSSAAAAAVAATTTTGNCPLTQAQMLQNYSHLLGQSYLHGYGGAGMGWMLHQRAASMYSCHSDTTTATNTTSSDSELDLNGLNEGLVDDEEDELHEDELSKLSLTADELLYNNLLLHNNNNSLAGTASNQNLINNLLSNHKPPCNRLLQLRAVLEKNALDRTEADNETILAYINSLPAFDRYEISVKRQLASVMILAIIENPFTVILTHNETLDSFCCLIHGTVEHLYVTPGDAYGRGAIQNSKILQPGDVFGITEPTMETIYFEGIMKTLTPFCWFLCVTQLDFYRILSSTQLEIIKHEEDGKVTLVTELRKTDGQKRGHVVIRGTPERLLSGTLENDAHDLFYIDDFLLTYRVFMPKAQLPVISNGTEGEDTKTSNALIPTSQSQFSHLIQGMENICSKLLIWFDDPTLRDKVIRIVLSWINNFYLDFDLIAGTLQGQASVSFHNSGQLFLDLFEQKLSSNLSLLTQARLLHIGLSTKAKTRHINLTRSNRDEEFLHFSISGGYERGFGIFVSKVDNGSKVEQLGLRCGDQILEVNGINFTIISHMKAMEVLKSTTHLQLTVKYNPYMFKEMLNCADGRSKKSSLSSALLSFPNASSVSPVNLRKHSAGNNSQNITGTVQNNGVPCQVSSTSAHQRWANQVAGSGTKIKKALPKFANFISKRLNFANEDSALARVDQVDFVRPLVTRSMSNPDLHSSANGKIALANHRASEAGATEANCGHLCQLQQHILRIFNAASGDHRYLFIHPETTAREVVMVSVREFGLGSQSKGPSSEHAKSSLSYSLYEVSVVPEANNTVRQRRLPDQLNNLAERASIHSRYYVKENVMFGSSSSSTSQSTNPNQLSEELGAEILKECPMPITLLSLNTMIIAQELTYTDFAIFRAIEPQSFVFDLFEMETDKLSENRLTEFEALSNREMFWVVNEILNELSLVRRVRIIKYFIKVANVCRNIKNYNSMFAILCGLGHGSVQRLKQTWEKVPAKYQKLLKALQTLMDPSRNMMHYRRELAARSAPIIPFFPIVKKDLTFLHLAHMTITDDNLVNFDKLRMISKEIRAIVNMASQPYVFPSSVPCAGAGASCSGCAGGSSSKNGDFNLLPEISGGVPLPPPPPTLATGSSVMPRRLFEEALMRKKVRSYFESNFININFDEDALLARSNEIEPGAHSNLNQSQHSQSSSSLKSATTTTSAKEPVTTNQAQANHTSSNKARGSPTLSSTSSGSSSGRLKFGAESPHQLRKLMSLSEVCESGKPKTHHHHASLPAPSSHTVPVQAQNTARTAHTYQPPTENHVPQRYSLKTPVNLPPTIPAQAAPVNNSTQAPASSHYRAPLPEPSNILMNTVSFNAPLSIESSSVTSFRRLEQLQQLKKFQEQSAAFYSNFYGNNSNSMQSQGKCASPVQRPPLPNYDEAVHRQQKLANLVSSTVVRSVSSSSQTSSGSTTGRNKNCTAEDKVSTV